MLKEINFPQEALSIARVFHNQPLLEKCRHLAECTLVPEKVERVFGPLIFPAPPLLRPYLTGCLVLSMDGRMGFESTAGSRTLTRANCLDRTEGLADLWILNLVRTCADAILLGSGTLRDEPEFTGHVYDPELQAFREAHPERFHRIPWNVILTREPEKLPWEHPVLSSPPIPVLLVIPDNQTKNLKRCPGGKFRYGVISGHEALKSIVPTVAVKGGLAWEDERIDPRHLVITLPQDRFPDFDCLLPLLRKLGIRQMTVESPYWIWRLMDAKVLDEFFLNYTGIYAGGSVVPGKETVFSPEEAPAMELASLHLAGKSLVISRQMLHYPGVENRF